MSRVTDRYVDQPAAPRAEERLETNSLEAFLDEQVGLAGPLVVKQFPSGHSNLTYWLTDGQSEWVLRRPPFGTTVRSAHDMGREYRILSGLHRAYDRAPRAMLRCADTSVIGAPFYLMERVTGVIIRRDPPPGLDFDDETARRLSLAVVDNLAAIHAVDLELAGLSDLGHPEGYIERQVKGWTRRYQKSRTDDIAEIEDVAEWLADKMPHENDGVLIHNDYKHDNLVLDPDDLTRIVAVLDWEMATVGHPLMDLGSTLSYWVEPADPPQLQALRFVPTHLPGTLSRAEVVDRYASRTGRDCSGIDFYRAFGLFKTAVVAQQIYYRYHAGKTSDPRFEMMIAAVRVLADEAARIVATSSL